MSFEGVQGTQAPVERSQTAPGHSMSPWHPAAVVVVVPPVAPVPPPPLSGMVAAPVPPVPPAVAVLPPVAHEAPAPATSTASANREEKGVTCGVSAAMVVPFQ